MGEYLLKVVVVGCMGVGKTSLLLRYCDDTFPENHVTTIGVDFKMRTVERKDWVARMQLWDTAGMDRFRTIVSSFYRGAHGLVVVYDVTDRSSFEKVPWWLHEAKSYGNTSCIGLLVGNKTDRDWERAVSTKEGKDLASQLGIQFFETSAKESSNVQEAFDAMADTIVSRTRSVGGLVALEASEQQDGVVDIRSSGVGEGAWCSGDLYSCVAM